MRKRATLQIIDCNTIIIVCKVCINYNYARGSLLIM